MVRAYSSVCLMAASAELSTGNLLKASAAFSLDLPGIYLILYLNFCMYNIHPSILAEGGFECGASTVISSLWSVQISKSFHGCIGRIFHSSTSPSRLPSPIENICFLVELANGSRSVQVCAGHLLVSVLRQPQYLKERHLW